MCVIRDIVVKISRLDMCLRVCIAHTYILYVYMDYKYTHPQTYAHPNLTFKHVFTCMYCVYIHSMCVSGLHVHIYTNIYTRKFDIYVGSWINFSTTFPDSHF